MKWKLWRTPNCLSRLPRMSRQEDRRTDPGCGVGQGPGQVQELGSDLQVPMRA